MRVTPGTNIPFWLKLWDDSPSRYVVAHLTALDGTEQPGSPYLLTYSGNRGIYTGVGPVMGSTDLRADYEVFVDSGLTTKAKAYLPSWEDIVADISVTYALSQILGKLTNLDPNVIQGVVDQTFVQATLDTSKVAAAQVDISSEQGIIDNSKIAQGSVDSSTILGGEET